MASMISAGAYVDIAVADTAHITADGVGAALDVSDFEGALKFWIAHKDAAGTTPTLAVKLQHSATSGGTYVDVPGAVFAAIATTDGVQQLTVDQSQLAGFVKFNFDIGGTTPDYIVATGCAGVKRYRK